MSEDTLMPLLEVAIEAALAGGAVIMEVYASDFTVDRKADRSPLTEADRRSHDTIQGMLQRTGAPVLSEEGTAVPAEKRQAWDHYWLVDPLDGTREFVDRNGEFAVCIAWMQRVAGATDSATPRAGVIYSPVQDKLYFAADGVGSFCCTRARTRKGVSAYERVAMSTRLPFGPSRRTYTILASRSHRSPETEAYIAQQQQERGEVVLAAMGSALKFGLLAEGTADAYPRYGPTMEWDTAAGQIICSEAGKQVIDLTTNAPMRYNKHELVNNWFIVH